MVVEKAQPAQGAGAAVGSIALVIFKIQQIILNHLVCDFDRRLLVVFGKPCDGGKVSALGVGGKVFKFHNILYYEKSLERR